MALDCPLVDACIALTIHPARGMLGSGGWPKADESVLAGHSSFSGAILGEARRKSDVILMEDRWLDGKSPEGQSIF